MVLILVLASKKDNKLLEEVERTVKQHCDVIEMQKSRIMEQNQELEELRQQKDRVEQVEQGLFDERPDSVIFIVIFSEDLHFERGYSQ